MLLESYGCCFQCGVYACGIVVVDLEIQSFQEDPNGLKAGNGSKIFLELAVEGFLIPVLPRRGFRAKRCLNVMLFEQRKIGGAGVFAPLIRMQVLRSGMCEKGMAQGIQHEHMVMPVRE